jgi:hypothetical protein
LTSGIFTVPITIDGTKYKLFAGQVAMSVEQENMLVPRSDWCLAVSLANQPSEPVNVPQIVYPTEKLNADSNISEDDSEENIAKVKQPADTPQIEKEEKVQPKCD